MSFTATARAGDAITHIITRDDLWELQQDVADYASDELTRYYNGRDWAGRSAAFRKAADEAFRLGEGYEQVGPLPTGITIAFTSEPD